MDVYCRNGYGNLWNLWYTMVLSWGWYFQTGGSHLGQHVALLSDGQDLQPLRSDLIWSRYYNYNYLYTHIYIYVIFRDFNCICLPSTISENSTCFYWVVSRAAWHGFTQEPCCYGGIYWSLGDSWDLRPAKPAWASSSHWNGGFFKMVYHPIHRTIRLLFFAENPTHGLKWVPNLKNTRNEKLHPVDVEETLGMFPVSQIRLNRAPKLVLVSGPAKC